MRDLERKLNGRKTLCFIDLEGTQFSHEMIAIGAVRVDLHKDLTIKKYRKGYYSLVLPKQKIGKVVTDLTGLTEEKVKKEGKPFRVVINELKKYMGREFTKTLFVAFGSHDFRILSQSLAYNLDAPKEDVRMMINHGFDFSEFISNYVRDENNNTYSLSNMLKIFDVGFKGQQHNAYCDALNLAYLYQAMLDHPEIMKNEYKNVLKNIRHLPRPIHDVIQKLNEGETVTPEYFDKIVEESLK